MTMRILLAESDELQQEAAQATLAGHRLVIAESWHNALNYLEEDPGIPISPCPFDAVLANYRMFFCSRIQLPGAPYWELEGDFGMPLAVKAALCGAKFVAVAQIDRPGRARSRQSLVIETLDARCQEMKTHSGGLFSNVTINGARALFCNAPMLEEVVKDAPCLSCKENPGKCPTCKGDGVYSTPHLLGGKEQRCLHCLKYSGLCSHCKGTAKVDVTIYEKIDWGEILKILTV